MNPVTGLSVGRIAVGAIALGAPDLAGKLFGLDGEANPQLPYVSRLFGSREVAIGALTLIARGSARRNLVLVGVAIDAADAATGYLGIRSKQVPGATGAMLIGPAIGAMIAGLTGLRVKRRPVSTV